VKLAKLEGIKGGNAKKMKSVKLKEMIKQNCQGFI
jgi:hypothetical protein